MTGSKGKQLEAVVDAVREIPTEYFEAYGGGWPSEVSTALLDAVFSMRATYRSDQPGVGVFGRLMTFRTRHEEARNDLALLQEVGEEEIQRIMGRSVSAQRRKSAILTEVAGLYVGRGVRTADDFRSQNIADMKKIYTSVRGLNWVTFEYFTMHLGAPGVKADTMIVRFVNWALEARCCKPVQAHVARDLVVAAQEETGLGETLRHFDHAIWKWESDRA